MIVRASPSPRNFRSRGMIPTPFRNHAFRTLVGAGILFCAPRFLSAFTGENGVSGIRSTDNSIDKLKRGSYLGHRYSPSEWDSLSIEARVKLAGLLSWERLSGWDFDIREVARWTDHPLLLVGWAILCEPSAQGAMKDSLAGVDEEADVDSVGDARTYHFREHLKIDPRTICNFLREIERRYCRDNPYHNNVHAADVTQTVHCLFQFIDEQYLKRIFDPITIFSLILAATFHDVGHPGTNNLFQQNAKTRWAIDYLNKSILENMHAAVGRSLLLGDERRDEWDIFRGWTHGERARAEEVMTRSILSTDMARHSAHLEELSSLISKVRNLADDIFEMNVNAKIGRRESRPILSMLAGTLNVTRERKHYAAGGPARSRLEARCRRLADAVIGFILHAADLSGSAKAGGLPAYWGNRANEEFFAQGDKEKKMGLPVSPGCNRDTLKRPEAQIGFIANVIRPTYEILGGIVPRVRTEVMPNINKSLEYWDRERARSSTFGGT